MPDITISFTSDLNQVTNIYDRKFLKLMANYCKKTIGNEILVMKEQYSYYIKFVDADIDLDLYLKYIRRLMYKFQYFIYTIQVESAVYFSLKLKTKDFDRHPSITTWNFDIDDKYLYLKKECETNNPFSTKKYLKSSEDALLYYKEREKPFFDTFFNKYGKYIQPYN